MSELPDTVAVDTLATNLQRLLAERGWSVRHLAREANEPHMSVQRLVNGEHKTNWITALKVASALDTTIEELAGVEKFSRAAS